MSDLIKVNYSEYGLQATEAAQIEAVFIPMIDKMNELESEFNEILSMPIEPTTCKMAKELRLKYVKVRTGTESIHKKAKAYYLAGGKFVDGWKNAQAFASQGKEEALEKIEKHYELMEKARKEQLRVDRWNRLSKYMEIEPTGLGDMTDAVWDALLKGTVDNHNARIEAERKAEEERIAKEKADEEERARIKAENERLKKEAQERERAMEIERKKQAEILAKQKAQADKERQERERAEAELKAKKDAELAKEKAEKEALKKAERAPDKVKLQELSVVIKNTKLPQVKTEEAEKIINGTRELLFKVSKYIDEQIKLM